MGLRELYLNRNMIHENIIDKSEIYMLKMIKINHYNKNRILRSLIDSVELTDEQQHELDDFYVKNYGKKVLNYWHRLNIAYNGCFDVRYIPETIFNPEFERFSDDLWKSYRSALSDKNFFPLVVNSTGIKTPQSYITRTRGIWRDEDYKFTDENRAYDSLKNAGKVFIKETVASSGGKGCFIADFHNGVDLVSGKTVKQLLSSAGQNFAVQECIVNHKSLSKINPDSVNTFRVMTYNWKNKIELIPLTMRVGKGKMNVDNLSSGGLIIAVENDGTLHNKAVSVANEQYTVHPDSGVVFENYKIPYVDKIIDSAVHLHEMMPQLGIVSWDFTLDEAGEPVLIEMNCRGESIWVPQMAWGKGAFGDNTEDILNWMRIMKKTKHSQRVKYAYGQI